MRCHSERSEESRPGRSGAVCPTQIKIPRPGLLEENPAFGASVIGGRETGVGLNAVLGEDTADMFTEVGSAGAYEGQD